MINKEFFKYQLLDDENTFIKEMTNVESAKISYSSSSKLKLSGNVDVCLGPNENIDTNQRIRIIHVLNGVENMLCTLLMSTPSHKLFKNYKEISIECYSVLWLHEVNKITARYSLTKGTNVVNEVKRLIGQKNVDIIPSSLTTNVDLEWEIGTSILDICNQLLECINYTPLYPLPDGLISSEPYILPQDKLVTVTYDDFDRSNKVEGECVSELDFFDTPNVFVRYVNNPNTIDLVAVYENTNPDSPTSVVNRPRNVDSQEIRDAANVQVLMDIAKKDCATKTNKYHTVEFKTAINHRHGFETCIYLNLNGVSGKFIEQDWDIDCICGGEMNHVVRRIVEV